LILEDTAARSGFDAAMDKALTSPRVSLDRPRLERVMSGRCYDDDDLRDTFAAMLPLYGDEPMSPEQVASVIGRVDFHAETHNWAFSKNQPAYNVLGRLGEIHCPTLINVGRSDWITPVEAAEELARGIASSELVIYDHSGHSPHLDEADRFTEVVSQFLVAHALTKTMTT
jgi:proline iminopeptidase